MPYLTTDEATDVFAALHALLSSKAELDRVVGEVAADLTSPAATSSELDMVARDIEEWTRHAQQVVDDLKALKDACYAAF